MKKIFGEKKYLVKKILSNFFSNFLAEKMLLKNFFGQKIFLRKNIWSNKIPGQKKFWLKKFLLIKKFCSRKYFG